MVTIAFVDTEATGLDRHRHQVWEIGVILRRDGVSDAEHLWHVRPHLAVASPDGLRISRYYERTAQLHDAEPGTACNNAGLPPDEQRWSDPAVAAGELAYLLDGALFAAAVPSFDDAMLDAFLRRHDHCPTWHYQLIDVATFAAGVLTSHGVPVEVPWDGDDISRPLGVQPPSDEQRHTALGDARWARDLWDASRQTTMP